MLSRKAEAASSPVQTEEQMCQRAEEMFRRHKYNFVLVSSTNLDSIMEFYHHTPKGMHFVCDAYQAEVILTAMHGMERKGNYSQYQPSDGHSTIWVKARHCPWSHLRRLGSSLKKPVEIAPMSDDKLKRAGFAMLVRKNTNPVRKTIFEEMRDEFYPLDGQIIYSMWDGYLKPEHADRALIDFIGGAIEHLHTSGHAYVETISRLIKTVRPKVIVPIHTERADEFTAIPDFAPYRDRVRVLQDGEKLLLDEL